MEPRELLRWLVAEWLTAIDKTGVLIEEGSE